jgi:Mrp family chromosome partitioning ATPase
VELSLVIAAIARRPWLPVLLALLGGVGMYSVTNDRGATEYEAAAVILVQPPSSEGAPVYVSDPDRYVISQIPALRSLGTVVETELSLPADSLDQRAEISHEPNTDLVVVTVSGLDPTEPAEIANAWADLYIKDLSERASRSRQADREALNQRIEELSAELVELETRIQLATEPFDPEGAPGVTVVTDPEAVARREVALQELAGALNNRDQLELAGSLKVNSEVVSYASTPDAALESGNTVYVLAGAFFGLLLGIAIAILWAQLSSYTFAPQQVAQALGHPVVGTFRRSRHLATQRTKALSALPTSTVGVIDQLCVRAEANAGSNGTLTVAVVGTERNAGCSTLAAALAGRFAASGTRVLLIDADQHEPELTRELGGTRSGGIPALLATTDTGPAAGTRRSRRAETIYTPTPEPDVMLLGHGSNLDAATLHRTEVRPLLEVTSADSPLVTVDAGSVLDSAVAVQFCHQVDTVVLAVPLRHQRKDGLEVVSRQLRGSRAAILPVVTEPHRRFRRGREAAVVATVSAEEASLS